LDIEAGAVAVPLNFRYTAEEIKYCLELSDSIALVFGPEFIGRIENIYDQIIPKIKLLLFAGENRPSFAESYDRLTANCPSEAPKVEITDDDDAAIYFSSGTTGFPKAILHAHRSLVSACYTEQKHHGQTREIIFVYSALYHTGAKMHWFGSLLSGSKAVLLRGIKPEWILRTVQKRKLQLYGFLSRGPRISWMPLKEET